MLKPGYSEKYFKKETYKNFSMESLTKKLQNLKKIIRDTGGCAVAYSGGVDSTLILTISHGVLGKRCIAVIATSPIYPKKEFEYALNWVKEKKILYRVVNTHELDIQGFKENTPDRCYICKRELFKKVKEIGLEEGVEYVIDGTNADDISDYRPGMLAAKELGVISPLIEADLTKDEIRFISREVYKLPTADKPQMACLASRFPYYSSITEKKLKQVEGIEEKLFSLGLRQFRARHHGNILRVELSPDEINLIMKKNIRKEFVSFAKNQGFTYITLDMEGYRSGSMNETLKEKPLVFRREE